MPLTAAATHRKGAPRNEYIPEMLRHAERSFGNVEAARQWLLPLLHGRRLCAIAFCSSPLNFVSAAAAVAVACFCLATFLLTFNVPQSTHLLVYDLMMMISGNYDCRNVVCCWSDGCVRCNSQKLPTRELGSCIRMCRSGGKRLTNSKLKGVEQDMAE